MTDSYNVIIDGKSWTTDGISGDYDAIDVVAGAVLAGADTVEVERWEDDEQ